MSTETKNQRPIVVHNNSNSYAQTRSILRNAWNTAPESSSVKYKPSYRTINNIGDKLHRQNYSCGGSCQTPQSTPGVSSIKNSIGSIISQCDSSGIQPATCNVKYVSDSSNYTKFLRQQSMGKSYNDSSFGGTTPARPQFVL